MRRTPLSTCQWAAAIAIAWTLGIFPSIPNIFAPPQIPAEAVRDIGAIPSDQIFAQGVLPAFAETETNMVHASLISNSTAVVPGQKFRLGIELKMQPGWHTYYKESGEAGMPTKVEWTLPAGFKSSEFMWERPHKMEDSGIITYGYNEHTVMAAEIEVPATVTAKTIEFKAKVKWLACKDACVPGSADLKLTLPVVASASEAKAENKEAFAPVNFNGPASEAIGEGGKAAATSKKDGTEVQPSTNLSENKNQDTAGGLLAYLGFAFIGGFILNFMPCVLPVISIKIFSLVQQAGDDPKKVFQHGLTFAAGILMSFLALGGLVIALQGAGQKIGWGFQFQYPIFIMGMASVVTVFALSMFGVFYIDLGGQKEIDKLASSEGLTGTFFKGVLATVLSTPCTAPFLGTALGFAFAQPWWEILAIFSTIAIGMASPYLVLAMKPNWMKFMPKPGTWMERFKESLGFLLLATTVWLISVLTGLVDPDAVVAAVSFLLVLSLCSWIVGSFINLSSSTQRKFTVWAIAIAFGAAGYWFFIKPFPELLGTKATIGLTKAPPKDGIQWQKFTQSDLDKLLSENKTVFIDFTAKWCLTCKANEATIIDTAPVRDKFKALNVVPLKADWTAQDPEISDLLRSFGRSGVPVYVIYAAGSKTPVVLPEALNQQIVLEALDKAGPSK